MSKQICELDWVHRQVIVLEDNALIDVMKDLLWLLIECLICIVLVQVMIPIIFWTKVVRAFLFLLWFNKGVYSELLLVEVCFF